MNRYYYINDDLDILEKLHNDLQARGVDSERIHLLSDQDAQVSTRHMNEVEPLAKKDMVRAGLVGALVGVVLAFIILVVALVAGLMDTVWAVPILFLAVVILGFCVWEGGLIGAHHPHPEVKRFQEHLANGQHVLFVDVEEREMASMSEAVAAYPQVKPAGTGKSEPGIFVRLRRSYHDLIHSLP